MLENDKQISQKEENKVREKSRMYVDADNSI